MPDHLPKYAPYGLISTHCATVSRKLLGSWVLRGWVRSIKTANARQSARLYSVADVEACLDRLAAGQQPRRKLRT